MFCDESGCLYFEGHSVIIIDELYGQSHFMLDLLSRLFGGFYHVGFPYRESCRSIFCVSSLGTFSQLLIASILYHRVLNVFTLIYFKLKIVKSFVSLDKELIFEGNESVFFCSNETSTRIIFP